MNYFERIRIRAYGRFARINVEPTHPYYSPNITGIARWAISFCTICLRVPRLRQKTGANITTRR